MGRSAPIHPNGLLAQRMKRLWAIPKYRKMFLAAGKRGTKTLKIIAERRRDENICSILTNNRNRSK